MFSTWGRRIVSSYRSDSHLRCSSRHGSPQRSSLGTSLMDSRDWSTTHWPPGFAFSQGEDLEYQYQYNLQKARDRARARRQAAAAPPVGQRGHRVGYGDTGRRSSLSVTASAQITGYHADQQAPGQLRVQGNAVSHRGRRDSSPDDSGPDSDTDRNDSSPRRRRRAGHTPERRRHAPLPPDDPSDKGSGDGDERRRSTKT